MKLVNIIKTGLLCLTSIATLVVSCVYLYNNQDIDLMSFDSKSNISLKNIKLKPGNKDISTDFGKEFYVRDLKSLTNDIVASENYVANMKTSNYMSSLLSKDGYFYILYEDFNSSKVEFRDCGSIFGDKGFAQYGFNFPRYSATLSRYYDNDFNAYCFSQKYKFDEGKYFYSAKDNILNMFKDNKSDLYEVIGDVVYMKVLNLDTKEYEKDFKLEISFEDSIYYKTINIFGVDPDQTVHVIL